MLSIRKVRIFSLRSPSEEGDGEIFNLKLVTCSRPSNIKIKQRNSLRRLSQTVSIALDKRFRSIEPLSTENVNSNQFINSSCIRRVLMLLWMVALLTEPYEQGIYKFLIKIMVLVGLCRIDKWLALDYCF